jgi:transcriptional regulator with XRE-family HTH domain
MVDLKKFGEIVKQERDRLNLSQEELSEKIGGGKRSRITAWERGTLKTFPSLETVDALAGIFSCDIDYLLGKQDLPTKAETDIGGATGLSLPAIKRLCDANSSKDFPGFIETKQGGNISASAILSAVNAILSNEAGLAMLQAFNFAAKTKNEVNARVAIDREDRNLLSPQEYAEPINLFSQPEYVELLDFMAWQAFNKALDSISSVYSEV